MFQNMNVTENACGTEALGEGPEWGVVNGSQNASCNVTGRGAGTL